MTDKIPMDDLTELLNRIYNFGRVYECYMIKAPLFRITPHEHKLFLQHLLNLSPSFIPEYYGDLPTYMGVNFQLVGSPVLFSGMHIRSDSGIDLNIKEMTAK